MSNENKQTSRYQLAATQEYTHSAISFNNGELNTVSILTGDGVRHADPYCFALTKLYGLKSLTFRMFRTSRMGIYRTPMLDMDFKLIRKNL